MENVERSSDNAFGDVPIHVEPCKCGYKWQDALPEDICHHAAGGGEYIAICPRCGADGELRATPKWAVEAWNSKRSATQPDVMREARSLLADQMTDKRKRDVLLSKSPATYAGGITTNQAIRAIVAALSSNGESKSE